VKQVPDISVAVLRWRREALNLKETADFSWKSKERSNGATIDDVTSMYVTCIRPMPIVWGRKTIWLLFFRFTAVSTSEIRGPAGILPPVAWPNFQVHGIVSPFELPNLKLIIHITARFRALSLFC
jgi:hypothetical protein